MVDRAMENKAIYTEREVIRDRIEVSATSESLICGSSLNGERPKRKRWPHPFSKSLILAQSERWRCA